MKKGSNQDPTFKKPPPPPAPPPKRIIREGVLTGDGMKACIGQVKCFFGRHDRVAIEPERGWLAGGIKCNRKTCGKILHYPIKWPEPKPLEKG